MTRGVRIVKPAGRNEPVTGAKIRYAFSGTVWQHAGPGGWYFVSLPTELSAEIRDSLKWQEEGWGRLKATAYTGGTKWNTAIWFDTKRNTYLLPLKADIRKKAGLQAGTTMNVELEV